MSRYEKGDPVRLLFVMAGAIRPEYMVFDKDRARGRIDSADPLIRRVGDLQFLGPFSESRRLERIAHENPARMSDQVSDLVGQLARVMPERK